LTSIADTRLLLTLEFPPSQQLKERIRVFLEKELKGALLAPTIV
jgi:hypothetical protein